MEETAISEYFMLCFVIGLRTREAMPQCAYAICVRVSAYIHKYTLTYSIYFVHKFPGLSLYRRGVSALTCRLAELERSES
jgi:hypothetical protein